MRRVLLALVTALALGGALLAPAAQAAPKPGGGSTYPSSMAATGDSITRAFDATSSGCFLSDCPQYSWSTGTSVNSQYARLLKANRKISGHVYNDAKTGAVMSALSGQLASAAAQQVDYVTVLMGANDLCTSSAATMTPTDTFRSQFQTAVSQFVAARPNAKVFVSSIPNIYQLWSLLHTNFAASATWSTFGICQSMLSGSNTEATRQLVVAQEQADNQVLAQVCAQFSQCRFDNLATYNTSFVTSDVSTVDYFHPSVSGQGKLANVTWAASFWG
jgi:lysophospholipase L1-like esterase